MSKPFKAIPKINAKVRLVQSDITKLEVDAITNAANHTLLGGGGVDGAIHRAAGPALLDECKTLKGCKTGEAKITKGYRLRAKHVIHTVGPIGENTEMLKNCYHNSLEVMRKHNLKSIAFPCISTGIYGYPNKKAACVALETVRRWLEEHEQHVDHIYFCLFLPVDVDIYESMMNLYFPSGQESDVDGPEYFNKGKDSSEAMQSVKAERNSKESISTKAIDNNSDRTKKNNTTHKLQDEKVKGSQTKGKSSAGPDDQLGHDTLNQSSCPRQDMKSLKQTEKSVQFEKNTTGFTDEQKSGRSKQIPDNVQMPEGTSSSAELEQSRGNCNKTLPIHTEATPGDTGSTSLKSTQDTPKKYVDETSVTGPIESSQRVQKDKLDSSGSTLTDKKETEPTRKKEREDKVQSGESIYNKSQGSDGAESVPEGENRTAPEADEEMEEQKSPSDGKMDCDSASNKDEEMEVV